ncbi:hypothetical protein JM946_07220 [Steroidobacter sp. S1-65]|uniref:DUF4136 domain-containing protein n=1 Tax=Steroidobacter gossypii TaxID=2805490 RepID=A0ABS1WU78_9GAMM|nr:hypothetical protein [Steroidobacter gossypii]MBM0104531.1 hypothetical protein [Steroidobacter gossypii]
MKDYRLLSRSNSWLHARRRQLMAAAACGLSATLVLLAGCGPVKLVANTNIPPPLVVKIPVAVALFMPTEFSSYVHKEERWSTKWHVDLGKAQTEGISRLMAAMFERVVPVESVNAGTQVPGGVAAILEPSIEEYAFVTPRDAGSPFYAVSIKYRVNVYMPDGKLADSWGFTGYGTSPSQGLSSEAPLSTATALAMRDAGAKLAVEFREQAVMRGLLPESATADSPAAGGTPPAPGVAPTTTTTTTPAAPAEKSEPKEQTPAGAGGQAPAAAPSSEPEKKDAATSELPAEEQEVEQQDEQGKTNRPLPEPEAVALTPPVS